MPRLRIVVFAAAAAMVFGVPASYAATVTVATDPTPSKSTTIFTAEPGETNDLDVSLLMVFTDLGAPLTAGEGCTSLGPNSAYCFAPNVDAYLRDGDDNARVLVNGIGRVFAGSGNDTVVADSFGAYTVVYGEGGADDIAANGEGGQIADGGPGDDVIHAGGFAGDASAFGRGGSDTIYFSTYIGGVATLDGGDGADTIIARPSGYPSTAVGGNGDDTIIVQGVSLFTPGGSYSVIGGAGDDTLTGGAYDDTIDGGNGRDSIDVQGGGVDTVTCGAGVDVVHFDASDTIAADCEVALS